MIYAHNIAYTPIITAIMKIHHNLQIYISIYVTGLNTLHFFFKPMSTSGKQIYHTNILRLFLSDYFQQFNISIFSKGSKAPADLFKAYIGIFRTSGI
jgi:hypothetical protein